MIKVIMVGPSVGSKGGISASINLLNNYLIGKGVVVTLVGTFDDGKSKIYNALSFILDLVYLATRLVFIKYDLVHVHMASRGSFVRKAIVSFVCLMTRTRYIIHLHGGGFQDFYRSRSLIVRSFIRFIFRNADTVIVLSAFWGEWLRNSLGIKKTEIIFNGIERIPKPLNSELKRSPKIVFSGLLGKNKGTDILISAFKDVQSQIPSCSLELCGNGDLDFYKKLAEGIPNVCFRGWVSADELNEVLQRSSIFCLPSWREGLPFSVLEAMRAGLPVVSTKVGSIPEAVVDGVTGLLVEPGDEASLKEALLTVLSNPELAGKMGLNGRRRQEESFSLESMGGRCFSLYKRLLSRSKNF